MEKTITQVSQETGIAVSTLHEARSKGRLPARRVGFVWLVDTANPQFEEFLVQHQKWLKARGKRDTEQEKE